MKRALPALLALLLCFCLTACNESQENVEDAESIAQQPKSDASDVSVGEGVFDSLADRIPQLSEIAGLSVVEDLPLLGSTDPYVWKAYAAASEQEMQAVLQYILPTDFSSFKYFPNAKFNAVSTGEGEVYTGVCALPMLINTPNGDIYLEIYSLGDKAKSPEQGVKAVFCDGSTMHLIGKAEAFDLVGLHEALTKIYTSTADSDLSGVVSDAVSNEKKSVMGKGNTAEVKGCLDFWIATNQAVEKAESYDVQFKVGQILYLLNTQTGEILKTEGSASKYGRVEKI